MPLLEVALTDIYEANFVDTTSYSASYNKIGETTANISSVIPFMVSFTNLPYGDYGPNNPAPIGVAVIGYNNYIL